MSNNNQFLIDLLQEVLSEDSYNKPTTAKKLIKDSLD